MRQPASSRVPRAVPNVRVRARAVAAVIVLLSRRSPQDAG